MFKTPFHARRLAAALLLCIPLIACQPGNLASGGKPDSTAATSATATTTKLDPILADPKEGDLYAAELTHFSAYEFEGAKESEKLFGLMKVTAVTPTTITAVTEDASWPEKSGALRDLRGDIADITWDESEEITIDRSKLAQLVSGNRIIESRRLGKK